MAQATLAKVGNSAAAFIPSATRKLADIAIGQGYTISSPRPKVVVLTFENEERQGRLARLKHARETIDALAVKPWDGVTDADELIREGKEARLREILLP